MHSQISLYPRKRVRIVRRSPCNQRRIIARGYFAYQTRRLSVIASAHMKLGRSLPVSRGSRSVIILGQKPWDAILAMLQARRSLYFRHWRAPGEPLQLRGPRLWGDPVIIVRP